LIFVGIPAEFDELQIYCLLSGRSVRLAKKAFQCRSSYSSLDWSSENLDASWIHIHWIWRYS